jgi:hypothetical protein
MKKTLSFFTTNLKKEKQFKYSKLAPVNSARIKYEADRTNKEFIAEYISALENYTASMMMKV